VLHGLSQHAQAGVSPRFRHRARVGVAVALSLAFIAASSSPALADQVRRNEWWLRTLHVTNAWETTRGSGVIIAVLDTGVDPAQPDLTGSVTTGPDYTNSGETPTAPSWEVHGTEVASLIAGHGHGPGQANGIIGIAPAAKIISARVTLESGDQALSKPAIAAGLPNAIAHGIGWAVRHHASVIDLPLDPVTTSGAPGAGGSAAEQAAVRYALAKHVVLVAPAGDEGTGTDAVNYPADYPGVIAVGAFDRQFTKAPFSSHQSYVTVTAAGAGVVAASPSGTYPQLNSTSAASAMVAGIVALIQAQFPTLTPAQITKALTKSTVYHPPGGQADGSGFGTVDAAKALTAAAGIVESVSKSASSNTAGQSAPTQPPVRSSPIHRNIRGTLIKDAILAGLVFLLLLGLIFGIKAWRRRNARSARLAEVRAAVQPPVRKPVVVKSAARGSAKRGSPAGAQAGASGPDTEAAQPELEPAGFIAAPLGPAAGGPGASGFTGSASAGFTGSASGFSGSGFTGSGSRFTGSGFSGSGFTGSGFTGSASSGFAAAGPAAAGSGGIAALGAAGITPPAGLGPAAGSGSPAGLGPAGISQPGGISPPPGLEAGLGSPAAGDPPAGFGPSAGLGSAAGAGSVPGAAAQDASPAGEAAPGLTQPAGAGAGLPPWALISQDPAAKAKAAASAAIPGSAFPPAQAAPPAGEAATGSEPTSGAAGVTRMSSRLTQSPRQRAPQVSGRPPWEPAAEPNSELPWAQAPAPPPSGAGAMPMPEQVRPALPAWEEMAQQEWPGGPKGAALHPPVPPGDEPSSRPGREAPRPGGARIVPAAGLVPPQPDSPEQPRRTEDRPDYAWNTGAGVGPFRAAQADPGAASGATAAAQAGIGPSAGAASPTVGPPAVGPSAVSQPGISPARRPSLALPRRLGSSTARQAGGAAGPGNSGGRAEQTPASGLPVPGPRDGGVTGSGAAGSASGGPDWPVAGTNQPPFPPAPRPAAEPGLPGAAQAERGPFPRAIKPPTDPGAAGSAAWGVGPTSPRPSGASPAAPALPGESSPAKVPGPVQGLPPSMDPTPLTAAEPGPAKRAAAKPEAGSARPKTGVPPWEITDSFLAVPPAGPSAPLASGTPAASQPSNPRGAATWGSTPPDARQPSSPGTWGSAPAADQSSSPGTWDSTPPAASQPSSPGPWGSAPSAASQPSSPGMWGSTPPTASQPSGAGAWGGGPAAANRPRIPGSTDAEGADPADSTESFPTVGPGADQRSFPRSNPGDSTESFPAMRSRADIEDAFRLFPPVRGTDNRPPAGSQD